MIGKDILNLSNNQLIESINNDSYIEEKVINIMAGYIVGEIKYTL